MITSPNEVSGAPDPVAAALLDDPGQERHCFADFNVDAVVTTDILGVIIAANPSMCDLAGRPIEALIGSAFKGYFTDPKAAEDGIRKVLAEDSLSNLELAIRSSSGLVTPVSCNAVTFRSPAGKLQGVMVSIRDATAQKERENGLLQAQHYTRGLIEASFDALLTVDPELRIIDVNEQTARLTGFSREELVGSFFAEYFADPKLASAAVAKTLAEAFINDYVLKLRSKTGQEKLISFNASVYKDTEGTVRGIFAAGRDITGQTLLEEELRQSQNYTRGLIEASIDPIFTVDADLTITDVNEQMARLTEIPKSELIGSRFDTLFTEPDRATAGVRETLRESSVTNYELTLRTRGARLVPVSFNASIFKDTTGKVRGIFAVARDVTEQRTLEHELQEQQNYARGLIEAVVDALITIDPQGRIIDVNEQMVRLTGFNKKRLMGRPFADFFNDPERARAGIKATLETGVVKSFELIVRTKSGALAPVSFDASTFQDTSGKVAGMFASARDTSEQIHLQQKLVEQQAYTRGLIESNIDPIMTTDSLGIITDVNRQMCTVTGCELAQLIGTPFKDYFTDPKRAEDAIRKVLADGRVTNYELTIRARDGKETLVSYNATTFMGEDGKLRGVFAAARDITDQKLLEEQLRFAQNYNRGLIESSVDAMFTVDLDNTITEANEQTVKLLGYSREHLVGSSFEDYFAEPLRAVEGVQRTLQEGSLRNCELSLRARHRRQVLVSFNASVFKDTEGVVRGIFAVARDITEQTRLEEKLRESENYNRGLIESSVDALLTVDPSLFITDVNHQMIRLTGYSREALVGSPFRDYFTEPARATAGVRQTFDEGSLTNYELVLKSLTGRRTLVSFNAGTFNDTSGKVAGIMAAARDITAQKRTEEQLRDQQSYNRSLIESRVDALLTVDPQGIITDINEQAVRLTGYNRRQLEGSRFIEYFTDADSALGGFNRTFEEGSVTNYELVLRAKSGRKIPVSFNAAVLRDMGESVMGILVVARDNSEQKRIEQAMRELQVYTRGLIESNIDALMTTDTLGIITDANRQMCAVTGRTQEQLVGTPFKDYFTDAERAENAIRQVLSEDRVTNYELTLKAQQGRELQVSYNATTFRGADGKLRGVFAAARDITDQRRLEDQIREQNRALTENTAFINSVLESSSGYSIIALGLDGGILAWNEGARRNYGYTAEEMVGNQSFRVLHTAEDVASGAAQRLLSKALDSGRAEAVMERVRQSGHRFTASIVVTLRRDIEGAPIGYVLISKDITEQKRLEKELQHKNVELEEQNRRVQEATRLKSEFLANMSHELRTPLNGIIGFSELMHDGKVGPVSEDHKEYLGDILTSSRHLQQLINDVLDLAKVESGKMEFRPERVDLGKVVGEVRDILRTLTAEKRLLVTAEADPELGEIVIDPAKLKQVLYNYLSNAIKFTPDEGRVTIRAVLEGSDSFRLEVQDTGIGISAQDIPRLFVEFQQLDASSGKRYQGTGLGLALTRTIVEAQGGEVGVTSLPGEGSTFYAVLPREAFTDQAIDDHIPFDRRAGQLAVLVVEDDVKARAWVVETLTKAGYAVETAASGEAAMKAAQRSCFDAVTLDLLLPDMSGWDVLRSIRSSRHNHAVPAIVLTVVAERGQGLGFVIQDFLTKPVQTEELLAALSRVQLSEGEHSLLVIDDDPITSKLIGITLHDRGYSITSALDGAAGLVAAQQSPPSVVILDLLMPGMDGLEFIYQFRLTEVGRKTPVIVWTDMDLTRAQRSRLQASAQAIVLKGTGSGEALVSELAIHVRRSERSHGG